MYLNEYKNAIRVLNKAHKENKPIIFFDTETEGLDAEKHHIIQISATKVDPFTLDVIDKYETLINPMRALEPIITEITGLTDKDLFLAPIESQVFPDIKSFFDEKPYVCGHNIPFDIKMLSALYKRNSENLTLSGRMDTCQLSRELLKKGKDIADHKLKTVADYFGVSNDITFHNAGDDILATLRIFKVLMIESKKVCDTQAPAPLPKLTALGCWYWSGYRGRNRIYVRTDMGNIYYDTLDKIWGSKDLIISDYDLSLVLKKLMSIYHFDTLESLAKRLRKSWCDENVKKQGQVISVKDKIEAKSVIEKAKMNNFDVAYDGMTTIKFIKFNPSGKGKEVAFEYDEHDDYL